MPLIRKPLLTWTTHLERWGACDRCPLAQCRKRVCLARGKIPSDVLFIAEAPGESEDVLGQPLIGPAGQMLDGWIADSGLGQWRCCFTNVVGCIPKVDGGKAEEPPHWAMEKCQPRLQEIIELCSRGSHTCGGLQLVVTVGSVATDQVTSQWSALGLPKEMRHVPIVHPAAALRAPIAQKSLIVQKAVVTLARAAEDMIPF